MISPCALPYLESIVQMDPKNRPDEDCCLFKRRLYDVGLVSEVSSNAGVRGLGLRRGSQIQSLVCGFCLKAWRHQVVEAAFPGGRPA